MLVKKQPTIILISVWFSFMITAVGLIYLDFFSLLKHGISTSPLWAIVGGTAFIVYFVLASLCAGEILGRIKRTVKVTYQKIKI